MNSAGGTQPRVGWFQRTSASIPTMARVMLLHLGCKKKQNSWLSSARSSSPSSCCCSLSSLSMVGSKRCKMCIRDSIKGVITPEDEVSRIYINFCNPWSKNDSSHKHRLTYPRQLIAYREFLKDGGEIYLSLIHISASGAVSCARASNSWLHSPKCVNLSAVYSS